MVSKISVSHCVRVTASLVTTYVIIQSLLPPWQPNVVIRLLLCTYATAEQCAAGQHALEHRDMHIEIPLSIFHMYAHLVIASILS